MPSTPQRGSELPSISICRAVASRAVLQEQIAQPGTDGGLPRVVVPAPVLKKRTPAAYPPRSRGVAGSGGGTHGWSTASATGAREYKAVATCAWPLPHGGGTPRSLSLPRKGVVSRLPPPTRWGERSSEPSSRSCVGSPFVREGHAGGNAASTGRRAGRRGLVRRSLRRAGVVCQPCSAKGDLRLQRATVHQLFQLHSTELPTSSVFARLPGPSWSRWRRAPARGRCHEQ